MKIRMNVNKDLKEKKIYSTLIQFIKFGIVGISNTLISYCTYAVLVWLGVNFLLSNLIGFVVSVLNSFYWNSRYVFDLNNADTKQKLKALIKTFISYAGTGLVLSSAMLILWIDIVQLSKYIAPIINLIITVPVNFVVNKVWAFKK
ncbi:GtrA family protein [Eubacterium sp. LFL-14]|uniref:GtrA family protein n=1 Tax=Eubacterium album TaxID=2978477 RepID=A0ABT2M346_9FIRM|nr:GtrA family protein [Eubacterium sp. LFL-14]MCT7398678.1 GtrA family protein [Eubacterium sp. LFL-14]